MDRSDANDLTHYGVKGMKWGVRKEQPGTPTRSTKKIAKADKKWEKKAGSARVFFDTHNAAARRMNKTEIDRINNKPEYKDKDFTKDSPLRRKYYKEYEDTFMRVMNEEAQNLYGTNASGTKRLKFVANGDDIEYKFEDIQHSDDDRDLLVVFDDKNRITSFQFVDSAMAQADTFVSDFLTHYGVKGMKWGVRKEDAAAAIEIGKIAGSIKRPNKKAARATFRKKVKESEGLHNISDKDLASALKRMEMERRYAQILKDDAAQRNKNRDATLKLLGKVGEIAVPLLIGHYLRGGAGRSAANTASRVVTGTVLNPRSRRAIG